MATQSLEGRVHSLEERVTRLEEMPMLFEEYIGRLRASTEETPDA